MDLISYKKAREAKELSTNIKSNQIMSEAITPIKTTFIEVSTNLIDKSALTPGNLDTETGDVIGSSVASVTPFMEIGANTEYTSESIYARCFYDSDKKFISGNRGNGTFTSPPNSTYIRISTTSRNEVQLNEGDNLLPYEPYFKPFLKNIEIKELPRRSVHSENIERKAVEMEHLNIINPSSNLVDKDTLQLGYTLSGSTGEPVPNSTNSISDFIEVKPNTSYIGNVSRYAFYNREGDYLRGGTGSYTTPSAFTTTGDTVFMRLVYYVGEMSKAQLNQGETMLDYDDFYYTLSSKIRTKVDTSIREVDKFIKGVEIKGLFTSPPMESMTDKLRNVIKHSDVYDQYDDLVTNYPEYVTRKLLGDDESGLPVYRYDFKPTQTSPTNGDLKIPKLLVVTGTHGYEKQSVWCTLQSMIQVCDNWKTDELLEALRWDAHIIIIPVNNPWGFDQEFERKNYNGVDLSRNMPTDWERGSSDVPTDSTYRGSAPLSELSSQYVYNILTAEKDLVFATDFHNFHTPGSPTGLSWIVPITPFVENSAKQHISRMTRKWKKEYSFMTQDDSIMFGTTNGQSGGTIANEAVTHGIQGSLMEVSRRVEEQPGYADNDSLSIELGVEFFINWLLISLKNNVSFYNEQK